MKKTFLIIPAVCFIVLLFYSSLSAEDTAGDSHDKYSNEQLNIKWERVRGAVLYEVQIKDADGNIKLKERVNSEYINFRLSSGIYKIRIGAVNKFYKVDSWSDWSDLEIKVPVKPEVISISQKHGYTGRILKDIILKGKNLLKGAKVYLKKGDGELGPVNLNYKNEDEITFDMNLKNAEAGDYSLVVKNPGGLMDIRDMFFTIKEPLYPRIDSITEDTGFTGSVIKDIAVTGKNLVRGCSIIFKKGDNEIQAKGLRYASGETIKFNIDLSGAPEGDYSLIVESPEGFKTSRDGAFSVKSSVIASWFTGDYTYGNFKLCAGMPYYMIQDEWGDNYKNSSSAVDVLLGYRFKGIGFLKKTAVINSMGLEAEFSRMDFMGRDDPDRVRTDMSISALGMNLFYHTGFNFPVNAVLRAGGGYVFTTLKKQDDSGSSIMSRDLYYKAGLAAEIRFFRYFMMELGADYHVTMYLLEDFQALGIYVRAGIYIF